MFLHAGAHLVVVQFTLAWDAEPGPGVPPKPAVSVWPDRTSGLEALLPFGAPYLIVQPNATVELLRVSVTGISCLSLLYMYEILRSNATAATADYRVSAGWRLVLLAALLQAAMDPPACGGGRGRHASALHLYRCCCTARLGSPDAHRTARPPMRKRGGRVGVALWGPIQAADASAVTVFAAL